MSKRLVEVAKFQVECPIDVTLLAEQFSALTDDAQAQFICMAAERIGLSSYYMQAHYIGRHLRDCECSTEAGRSFIREIFSSMEVKRETK